LAFLCLILAHLLWPAINHLRKSPVRSRVRYLRLVTAIAQIARPRSAATPRNHRPAARGAPCTGDRRPPPIAASAPPSANRPGRPTNPQLEIPRRIGYADSRNHAFWRGGRAAEGDGLLNRCREYHSLPRV